MPTYQKPEKYSEIKVKVDSIIALTGRKFLYTRHADGLSIDLQDKIDELVDGLGRTRDGQGSVAWRSIKAAYDDVVSKPLPKQLFGPKTHKDFIDLVKNISETA